MRDFPSCFGENGVQVADYYSSSSTSSSTSRSPQNLVTCIYQCRLRGRSCLIHVSWTKTLMGQGLSVAIDDASNQCICKVDIKPWLFSKKKGSKSLEAYSSKIDVFWDLSCAKFGPNPEPLEGFYVGLVVDKQMILLLGDLRKEAFKKTNSIPASSVASILAKREHIFGKKVFCTKARFSESPQTHDLSIECDTVGVADPCLVLRLDGKTTMQVKHLRWKFRGNHTIFIDGQAVEVFWDVYNWLFGTSTGNAIFSFKTYFCTEKMAATQPLYDPNVFRLSFSQRFSDPKAQSHGFSLTLYAWKNE